MLLGSLEIILQRISEILARLVKVLNVVALSTSHQREELGVLFFAQESLLSEILNNMHGEFTRLL